MKYDFHHYYENINQNLIKFYKSNTIIEIFNFSVPNLIINFESLQLENNLLNQFLLSSI